jgi:predicted AlkP superfamily phosphohydrolase/phosphomutase
LGHRVAIIGLDCAEPTLVFDRWLDDLPTFKRLAEAGVWGKLRSVDPPITVPAWSCMLTGKDPGELGIYGFRNRADYSYDGLTFANSDSLEAERVWDILGREGKHIIAIGVPQTYPPPVVNGELVSCFLTPDPRRDDYTYPRELKAEIESLVGPYQVDVRNFRSEERDRILSEVYEMTEQRFAVARHLLQTRPWDFFMMVKIGLDRIHHAFWRYIDPTHPKYEPNHPYEGVIKSYYQYLDEQIEELLEYFDDETTVFVLSDHGAKAMEGAICVNEWLIQEGYLTLKEQPEGTTRLTPDMIDWPRTTAWGEGGYYARLFLNVQGREPDGTVKPDDYERVRDELVQKLEALGDPAGESIGTRVYRPEQLWKEQRRIPPDLIAYFGNLAWRSAGSVGHGQVHTFENDTGPDDANHASDGMYIMAGP